jgi:SAM-dependent methyltransferase
MTTALAEAVERRPTPDFGAIKARQQIAWGSGDYGVVGTTLQSVGESICEAMDLRPGSRVLDVAAGNGNASLAAARRWCEVVSTDYVGTLLEQGRQRAAAERLVIEFREADAEHLPFVDASFDAVLSTFGVMFAPDQERAARELLRVCRSGGRIGLANWTPSGFIGQVFSILAQYLPPPAGLVSPSRWGRTDWIHESFGADAADIAIQIRHFRFRYRSPDHWLEVFRYFYGPIHKAFAALTPTAQGDLARDLLELAHRHNLAGDGTMVVPSEYLEVVVVRR